MSDFLEHITDVEDIKSSINDICLKMYNYGRADAIERCAEILAKHIRCFNCNLDCKGVGIDSCAENLRLFLDNLIKGAEE